MRQIFCTLAILLLASVSGYAAQPYAQQVAGGTTPGFIENRGQIADTDGNPRPDVRFTTRSHGVQVYITNTGLHYQFAKTENPEALEQMNRRHRLDSGTHSVDGQEAAGGDAEIRTTLYRLDMELVGANPSPVVLTEQPTGYYENYYLAHCPQGITGAQSFQRVVLQNVYPGIDWVLYRSGDFMKYDFVVHPGADPGLIRLRFAGADELKLMPNGSLQVTTPLGSITEDTPVSFQGDTRVASRFVLSGSEVSFDVWEYDREVDLVVDPALIWATYYGGSSRETVGDCVTDLFGNVYIAGITGSTGMATAGSHQVTKPGSRDSFLAKFDSMGVRLWATYYGGPDWDDINGCATDVVGNVYISGYTNSLTSIASNGHQNTMAGGGNDAFLVKFTSAGVRIWATYYGGEGEDAMNGNVDCTTDATGSVYLSGSTSSTTNIASSGHLNTHPNNNFNCAYLVKFDSSGIRQWGTYYGDTSQTFARGIAIDGSDNVYLAGFTGCTNGISSGGHQNNYHPGAMQNAFLVKFNSSGTRLWGTYYGGDSTTYGFGCATDVFNNVYLCGFTNSSTAIASNGHQNSLGGLGFDSFLVKFDSLGTRQWGTYYGGATPNGYISTSCDSDHNGNVYLSGHTNSLSGVAVGGHQNTYGGGLSDVFLVKFTGNGVRQWGTYYGGLGEEYSPSIATDGFNNVYLCADAQGSTTGLTFGGHQNTYGGGTADAVLAKFNGGIPCSSTLEILTLTSCGQLTLNGQTYSASGSYTQILANTAGCDSIIKLNLTIEPIDSSVTISSQGTISANQLGAEYQWLDCLTGESILGATQQSYTPEANGAFAVAISIGACTDTSECHAFVGIEDAAPTRLTFRAFPNPASGLLNVAADGTGPFQYTLMDATGRSIRTGASTQAQFVFNVEGLPAGVYLLHVTNAAGLGGVQRVVVQ